MFSLYPDDVLYLIEIDKSLASLGRIYVPFEFVKTKQGYTEFEFVNETVDVPVTVNVSPE
jgi:hypothetical protein